jgi:hypothetical protein
VVLTLKAKDLAYYDAQSQAWKLDSGAYKLLTAASSVEVKGTVEIRVE